MVDWGDIDINGVQLLYGCQGHGLVGGDNGPLGHIGSSDATGDGCHDAGVAQVDSGRFNGCFSILNISIDLFERSQGIVVILLTDGLFPPRVRDNVQPLIWQPKDLPSDLARAASALLRAALNGAGSI